MVWIFLCVLCAFRVRFAWNCVRNGKVRLGLWGLRCVAKHASTRFMMAFQKCVRQSVLYAGISLAVRKFVVGFFFFFPGCVLVVRTARASNTTDSEVASSAPPCPDHLSCRFGMRLCAVLTRCKERQPCERTRASPAQSLPTTRPHRAHDRSLLHSRAYLWHVREHAHRGCCSRSRCVVVLPQRDRRFWYACVVRLRCSYVEISMSSARICTIAPQQHSRDTTLTTRPTAANSGCYCHECCKTIRTMDQEDDFSIGNCKSISRKLNGITCTLQIHALLHNKLFLKENLRPIVSFADCQRTQVFHDLASTEVLLKFGQNVQESIV